MKTDNQHPRKPTRLRVIQGGGRPQRIRRKGEPQPTGDLGPPPDHLTDEQKACWKELSDISAPGVLTNSDGWAVELAASLLAQHRTDPTSKGAATKFRVLARLLSQLGLRPADRARLGVVTKKSKKVSENGRA